MYASIIFYALVALYGVMASPAQGPEVEPRAIEPRMPSFGDIPFPNFPVRNPQSNNMGGGKNNNCPSGGTTTQTNACSSGNAYCCNSDANGHVCSNTTACTSNIICCNNNNGFQICIGDIDFNMPITINVYE